MTLKNSLLITILLSYFLLCAACNRSEELSMQPYEGYPWLESREEIRQLLKDKCLDTISFGEGELIADIGAGNGYLEAMLAMYHDRLTFYIQDIDTAICNQDEIDRVVSFYENVNGKPFNCSFIAVNGTDTETALPDTGFDRILMLWTYQYLTEPEDFITEIRNKLSPTGLFYVINPEQDYEYGKELQSTYGWNGSTIEQQVSTIIDCGFTLVRMTRNYDDNQRPYMMMFKKKSSP